MKLHVAEECLQVERKCSYAQFGCNFNVSIESVYVTLSLCVCVCVCMYVECGLCSIHAQGFLKGSTTLSSAALSTLYNSSIQCMFKCNSMITPYPRISQRVLPSSPLQCMLQVHHLSLPPSFPRDLVTRCQSTRKKTFPVT